MGKKAHTACSKVRTMLIRHSVLTLHTGQSTPAGQEWVTRPCGVPLFSQAERESGVCRSCAAGWTHPENFPVEG